MIQQWKRLIDRASLLLLSLFLCWFGVLGTSSVFALSNNPFEQGIQAARSGEFSLAMQAFSRAIQADVSVPAAYANRCLVQLQLGNDRAAISDCTEALKLQPGNAEAYLNRGLAHYHSGDYTAAIADNNQALQLQPNDFRAYFNRGLAKAEIDRNQAAISDYDRALFQQPESSIQSEILVDRGLAYFAINNWHDAIASFNQALQLNESNDRAYYNRGCLHGRQGNYYAAIQDFTQALQLNPDHSEARLDRGIAQYQIGYAYQALNDLQQAAQVFLEQGKTLAHQHALSLIQQIQQTEISEVV